MFSCNNKYNTETKQLNKLLSNYNKTISQNNHIYILAARFPCPGCIQRIYLNIDKFIKNPDKKNISIIAYDKTYIPKSLLKKVEFIEDSNRVIDNIYYYLGNIIAIETNKSQIVKYEDLKTTDTLLNYNLLNKFFKE